MAKSNGEVEAACALAVPMIGTVMIALLLGTPIISVAVSDDVSTGANVTFTLQVCPGLKVKGSPWEGTPPRPQRSASVKFVAPPWFFKVSVTPDRMVAELLANVIVCEDTGPPTNSEEKIRPPGVTAIGCWQAVVLLKARQTVP